MSKKQRKPKKKFQRRLKPKHVISSQQNIRLRQAVHAQSTGDLGVAESDYRALIAEKIATPQIYSNLAMICAQTARRGEADSLWKKALRVDPRFLDARMNLADSCQQNGDIEQAIRHYERVISDHPDLVLAKYRLANLFRSQGKFGKASDYYQQVITRQADYTQAHFSYAGIHEYQDKADPHIVTMSKLYQQNDLSAENRVYLAFALAKAFEDIGEYSEAFEYLETGNKLRHQEFDYSIDSDRDLIQSIIRSFSREDMSRLRVNTQASKRPIFIVGMPRSGTSLVEKILSRHSDVFAAGELDYIFALGTQLFLKESSHFLFKSLETYSTGKFETLAETYLKQIGLLDTKASRLTDKMPFNMMMIGLIKIAIPNAKIIHCVREARDTCLSVYKQNFASGNYRFAYDLKSLGQFHNQYQQLMNHWHSVMPGEIYDIAYESLTHNPEPEIRKLLEACDLEWQENCLNFEKGGGTVKTASFYQVRQPMYTSSVRLWEQYRDNLQPLLDELEKAE